MTDEPPADEDGKRAGSEVELFRTDDYHQAGHVPLLPLLRTFFEPLLGSSLVGIRLRLAFLGVPDTEEMDGRPAMVNLRSSHGWVHVRMLRDHDVVYQHPHAVREIVGGPLQRLLSERFPDETHWGYAVRAPGLKGLKLVRPAPRAAHEVGLVQERRRRGGRFAVEEVPEPEPRTATLADLGVASEAEGPGEPVGVVVDRTIFENMTRDIPFSSEVEEGGFLAGTVYRAADDPEALLVHISAAVPAERTGASLMHFTFTGESFLRIGEHLDATHGALALVGWYHTHLFAATDSLGLSSVDVELHTGTFRKRGQVAALVNIDGSARLLRFYRSTGHEMVSVPYWVTP